jgi:hypothetical protein
MIGNSECGRSRRTISPLTRISFGRRRALPWPRTSGVAPLVLGVVSFDTMIGRLHTPWGSVAAVAVHSLRAALPPAEQPCSRSPAHVNPLP